MKRLLVLVLLLIIVLLSCATFTPFDRQDCIQLKAGLSPYIQEYGEWDIMQVKATREKQICVGYAWLDANRQIVHGVMFCYLDGEWHVTQQF